MYKVCSARQSVLLSVVFTVLLTFLAPLVETLSPWFDAQAHLAILRQGVESGEVPNAGDHHGARVITGDFDNDGFDDLAVAAHDESNAIDNLGDHGIVTINWGTQFGLTHQNPNPSQLSVGEPDDFHVDFGKSMAVGDFDNDGFDDLAVGAPGAEIAPNIDDAGQVFVYAGADFGINLAPYIVLDEGDAFAAIEAGDQFGYSMAAGDFNDDGFDDLVVGGIGENNDAGAIYWFLGGPGGLTAGSGGVISQGDLFSSEQPGALFGFSLATGDFRPGTFDDVCVGAPYRTVGGVVETGAVYVISGSATGLTVSGYQSKTADDFGLNAQPGSHFGWSLAAGQFFAADQDDDIAIGEPSYDVDGVIAAGRVVLLSIFIEPGKTEFASSGGQRKVETAIVLTQEDSEGSLTAAAQFGWSLASGKFDTDTYDDLAVGAPNYDAIVGTEGFAFDNVGSADLFFGAFNGPTGLDALSLDANDLNDWFFGFDEKLGWSVGFGDFDGNGREALVAGAPEKTYPAFIEPDSPVTEAGQVHVYAPWRQPGRGYPHRSALVYDCNQDIIYSQRLRQQLTPASTTKALTALLAVEAMQADPNLATYPYTVEPWIANNVSGSQYGLFPNEIIEFEDLVESMMAVSGNDCAYSIGDILTGEDNVWTDGVSDLGNVLEDFADIMNQRATQLGMSSAHKFSNPAGRPFGNHWTTAEDMAIFVVEAMKNEDFRTLVNDTGFLVKRIIPFQAMFPWLPPGPPIQFVDPVGNGWLQNQKAWHAPTNGVKPGANDVSQRTAILSGALDDGDVTAVFFGHPRSESFNNGMRLGRDLMQLVDASCKLDPTEPPIGGSPPPSPHGVDAHIPTDDGSVECFTLAIGDPEASPTTVDVVRQDEGTGLTSFTLSVARDFELTLPRAERCDFGMDDMEYSGGLSILNSGTEAASFEVTEFPANVTYPFTLQPGDEGFVAGGGTPGASVTWTYTVRNTGTDALLTITELGYGRDIILGNDRFNPPNWNSQFSLSCPAAPQVVRLCFLGTDSEGGASIGASVHGEDLVGTPAPEVDFPTIDRSRRHLGKNSPNPFNPSTTISYEVFEASMVSLRVFDSAGRLVRVLEAPAQRAPGSYQVRWDGTDSHGQTVASGIYLYQLVGEGFAETEKMVLLK